MNSAVQLGRFASETIRSFPLPELEWRVPTFKQWYRTLESVANSLDPTACLDYAAACARAWGDRLQEPAASA